MNAKSICILVGTMTGGLCLVGLLPSAEPPNVGLSESVVAASDDVGVRYAKACLDLAQVELQLMEDANDKLERTFSQAELEQKRANVRVAEEYFYNTLKLVEGRSATESIFLSQAREQAELAKRRYQRALETRHRDLIYSDLKLEKLRLEAEVAQLRLEVWSDPKNLLSMIEQLHWRVEQMSQEIVELQARVDDVSMSH